MQKKLAKHSQERRKVINKLYKNYYLLIKTWIYLWNKSVFFSVLKALYFYHCRSPPYPINLNF